MYMSSTLTRIDAFADAMRDPEIGRWLTSAIRGRTELDRHRWDLYCRLRRQMTRLYTQSRGSKARALRFRWQIWLVTQTWYRSS